MGTVSRGPAITDAMEEPRFVPMFQPDKYLGLDDFYEQKHRAVLVERGEVPSLLRLRGHNPNESLLYDPRYEPYFRRMDLLQFVLYFKGTPPWLNAMALTSLTGHWRPETHSFHLPLGEMTITLEDIAMITELPIKGRALTGKVRSDGWRQRVAALVGVEPEPWTHETRKDPRPFVVLFSWIQKHFRKCPKDASLDVVDRTNRQNNKSVINWEEHHIMWVDMWNAQRNARVETDQTPDTDEAAYLRHLEWIRKEYRVIHKGAWTHLDSLDLLPSEAVDGTFNNSIRETVRAHLHYRPLHDRVGTELWRCINDSNVVLGHAQGPETDELVRSTL
ncbi:hypothetical protein D1007_46516 [Hordeum vulgare]|nr:hypothetical protein D1007_46516 [Hordeum vulgare]